MVVSPKVTLLSYTKDALSTVTAAINQCYSAKSGETLKESLTKEKQIRLLNIVLGSGHLSTIEHLNFTFAIEGVSRALTHQLVRHRHASYSQQSQRYVEFKEGKFEYILPPAIKAKPELSQKYDKFMQAAGAFYQELMEAGIKAEDARMILPNATETKIVMTMNARSLLNFLEHRLCVRAQWEIRKLAQLMLDILMQEVPEIFKYAGPTCETQKICWEGNLSCGKWKGIKGAELRTRNTG